MKQPTEPVSPTSESPARRFARGKLRPATNADLAAGLSFGESGITPFTEALFDWKANDPEVDERVRATCPPGYDPETVLRRLRDPESFAREMAEPLDPGEAAEIERNVREALAEARAARDGCA